MFLSPHQRPHLQSPAFLKSPLCIRKGPPTQSMTLAPRSRTVAHTHPRKFAVIWEIFKKYSRPTRPWAPCWGRLGKQLHSYRTSAYERGLNACPRRLQAPNGPWERPRRRASCAVTRSTSSDMARPQGDCRGPSVNNLRWSCPFDVCRWRNAE